MARTIAAGEANRNFARLLQATEGGEEFAVTRNGVPVARITPVVDAGIHGLTPAQEAALARSMETLRRGWPLGGLLLQPGFAR